MDEAEARLRHQEGLAALASGLAHDFNNLLAVIRGTASVGRKKTPSDQPAHALFADIERLVDDASRVTNALLNHARDDAYVPERLNIDEFVTQCALDFARTREGALHLVLGEAGKHAHVDRTKLQQVVLNLLQNAADAVEDDLSKVSLRTRLAEGLIAIEVVDGGPGMDGDTLSRVFQPFFTTKTEGTGLGLVMARSVTHALGGTMSLESVPGEGTIVCVHLTTAL